MQLVHRGASTALSTPGPIITVFPWSADASLADASVEDASIVDPPPAPVFVGVLSPGDSLLQPSNAKAGWADMTAKRIRAQSLEGFAMRLWPVLLREATTT
ncbi:MAG TPA: hypothetical protein VK550_25045 [Polyangiaceae bacterium]|nr:hypothetical protein [Polyangiaceae bacterium]